ncbi:hypothetical protein AYO44_17795 [Planctomycetaceae bacterium SCGC AG-212-F19]|nr:hypothetical protein AYO44_17795 [Planctomycetaceae bacterium SCGC AG-212-F19]
MRVVTAIPVYNEERHLRDVLREVRRYSPDIVVINDGSTDGTAALLAAEPDIRVVTHTANRGYGAALISAFAFAVREKNSGCVFRPSTSRPAFPCCSNRSTTPTSSPAAGISETSARILAPRPTAGRSTRSLPPS